MCMPGKIVDDEQLDFEDSEDFEDQEDELCEASYTSDLEDDDPSGFICDMPEEEAAHYGKKQGNGN